jgi:nitronate monooxygenase
MRRDATAQGDVDRMQVWAGQAARLGRSAPAGDVLRTLWQNAIDLLGAGY